MKVNTQRLEEQANELREISYRMRSIQDSVLRTAQVLSRQRFGEQFRRPIRSAAGKVEKRSDDLYKLSTALQEIARIYERTEQDIVDETEQANIHFDIIRPGVIPIPTLPVLPIPTDVFEPQDWIYDPSDWFREQDRRFTFEDLRDRFRDMNNEMELEHYRNNYPRPRIPGIDTGDLPDPGDIWIPGEGIGLVDWSELWDRVIEAFDPIVMPVPETPGPQPTVPDVQAMAEQIVEQLPQTLGTGGYLHGLIDWTPWEP